MAVVKLEDICEVVRFHRKKAKLTQLELARISGVGKTVIFDLEKGKKTIKLETLVKILSSLNISLALEGPLVESSLNEISV